MILAQDYTAYNTENGLPSNQIYDIQEDADGFIWIATNRGLVKYDGKEFINHTLKDGLPNFPWLLELDLQGRMWYFSKSKYQGYIKNDSIYKYPSYSGNVITPASSNLKTKAGISFLSIDGILSLKKNQFEKQNAGLIRNSQKYENLLQHQNCIKSQNSAYFSNYNIEKNKLLLCTPKKLKLFDLNFHPISEIAYHFPVSTSKNIQSGLLYHQIGYIIFNSGIFFFDYNQNKYKFFGFDDYENEQQIDFLRVKGLENEIQVCINRHLFIFDYQMNQIDAYDFSKKFNNPVSYRDSQGNIWLGSQDKGIQFISKAQLETKYHFNHQRVHKINKIDNQLYVGLPNDGIYIRNQDTFELKQKLSKLDQYVNKIKQEGINGVICTDLKTFKIDQQKFSEYSIKHLDEFPFVFKDIIEFQNNEYFFTHNPIYKRNIQTKKVQNIGFQIGITHSAIFHDHLYIAGTFGLSEMKNDSIVKPDIDHSLIEYPVTSLLTTPDYLIVGTNGRGIYLFDEHQVIPIENTDDLSVFKIRKDGNLLWLATHDGVQVVELDTTDLKHSKIINSFYKSDGLQQNNTNDIFIDHHQLWVASDNGLIEIDTKNPIYEIKPHLFFKEKKDTIVYRNEERNNISITFGNQDFFNHKYTSYSYRISPSKQWVATSSQTLHFVNLAPGFHQLEIKGTDQHFNTNSIQKTVHIIPYWWETQWAKLIAIGLSLLSLYFLYQWLQRRITMQQEKKENIKRRVIGLELQALRSQMNPHFVHNSLNAILYFIQRNEVELSEKYLTKFSKLIRRFFDFAQKQHITLKEDIQLLKNYLEIEQLRFEEKLSFSINIDDRIDIEEQIIPTMILQPIVENAVNHGIFHKETPGTINIKFIYIDNQTYKVEIKDDGIGINKAKTNNTRYKNKASRSSMVLQERLLLLKESNEWNIDYKIIGLSEQNSTGTLVSILFKQNEK